MAKSAPVRSAPAPVVAPATAPTAMAQFPLGRNVVGEIEGNGDDSTTTLVLLVNVSKAALAAAPRSEKGNLVLSSTGGFQYIQGFTIDGHDIGVSLNIIGKKLKTAR